MVLASNLVLERVKSRKNANSGCCAYANNFTYNAAGAVTSLQLGNGTGESTAFNSRLQPTQNALGTVQSGYDKLKLNYTDGTTDNNGNVLTQTITVPTVGAITGFAAVQTYNYDSLNRLKDATESLTPTGGSATETWKQTFTFDRYGNRNFDEANTTTLPKTCGTSPNFTVCTADKKIFNPAIDVSNNRLDEDDDYDFDLAGNTTEDAQGKTFVYDGENKQVEVRNGNSQLLGEYWYDGDGKRVKKKAYTAGVLDEETIFVYDAAGKLVAEYSTVVADSNNAKVAYLTNDHLGSPRINTDATGQVISRHDYHPYGEEIARTGYGSDTIRKQFTGYERDGETGLDYAQARMYQPNHGRFSTSDPLYFARERVLDPQQFNLYVYVRNNPLALTDHTGLKIDPSRLNKDDKGKWDQIESLVNSVDENGNYLHPELKELYDKLNNDSRIFYIQGGELPNATAGQFEIEEFVGDSEFKSATITLDFEKIQNAKVGNSLFGDFKQFEGLDTKNEKRAEVAGHEFSHAADVIGDPEKVRLQKLVQDQKKLILESNRTRTPLPPNFQANEDKKNAYLERQERTAYGAEKKILQELRNSKEQRKKNAKN